MSSSKLEGFRSKLGALQPIAKDSQVVSIIVLACIGRLTPMDSPDWSGFVSFVSPHPGVLFLLKFRIPKVRADD